MQDSIDSIKKILICTQKYERDFNKLPTILILNNETYTTLLNTGYIKEPQRLSDINNIDKFEFEGINFDIYKYKQLSNAERLKIDSNKIKQPMTLATKGICKRIIPYHYSWAAQLYFLSCRE